MSYPGGGAGAGFAGVAERLDTVRRRIASAGRSPDSVTVVAVTKGFGIEAVRAAVAAGVGDLGENYAGELVSKASQAAGEGLAARWHFLGALQRNKVSQLAPWVSLWQSVARSNEGAEIARRSSNPQVLVQVKLEEGERRNGSSPAETPALVRRLTDSGLDVRGLMGIAPRGGLGAVRSSFERLAALGGELGVDELSMGMSDDLEVAVEAGATIVRVGRALFGDRPT